VRSPAYERNTAVSIPERSFENTSDAQVARLEVLSGDDTDHGCHERVAVDEVLAVDLQRRRG